MTTRYMLRFDDICPTMDWKAWDALEKAMDDECIRPIVAVIPDNKDPEFNVGPANPAFGDACAPGRRRTGASASTGTVTSALPARAASWRSIIAASSRASERREQREKL